MTLGRLPISETEVPTKKRSGALPGLCTAMKEIFITTKWNEIVFEILEAKITKGKKRTGPSWHGSVADICFVASAFMPEHQL